MKRLFQFALNCILIFSPILLFAQTQNDYQLAKIIPPSPTAASLGKFGDIPVGYYTGTPNISIPLYEIKTKDLSVPITLSYNANGLQVAQDASWVGLNWSLLTGGVVTRVVRGLDDFGGYGYYNYYKLPWHGFVDNSTLFTETFNYLKHIITGVVDAEPDVFSYNFAGYSGKFVIDKQLNGGKVFQSIRDNLDIKFDPLGSFFTITTPDGNEYYFATKETVANLASGEFSGQGIDPSNDVGLSNFQFASEAATSSWYLNKITSPNGDVIHFTYKTSESLSLISRSEKQFLNINPIASYGEVPGPMLLYNSKVDSRRHVSDVILQKIDFANGRVEFETSDRDDIERYGTNYLAPQQLSAIKVYNNSQTAPLKQITLGMSYFETFNPYGSRYYEKRLRLDYVQFDETANRYSFSYYMPTALPSKYSRQVDEWGFYTGYFDNPFNFSTNYPDLYPRVLAPGGSVDGVPQIRGDVTGDYLKRGILTGITYPTKGKTEFDYEPNDYSNIDPVFNKVTQTALLDFTDPDPNNQISGPENAINTFTLSESTWVTVSAITSYNGSDPAIIGFIRHTNGGPIYTFLTSQGNPTGAPYGSSYYYGYLPAGQYTIEAHELSGQMTRLDATYDERQPISTCVGGGLRIKSITNYDVNNAIAGKKSFGYFDGPTTTGILLNKARDFYLKRIVTLLQPSTIDAYIAGGDYVVRSSNSLFPEGFYSLPNLVGYSKVSVTEEGNTNNGTTIYSYYNVDPEADNPVEYYPERPAISNSRNGQLLSVHVLNASGDSVQRTIYNYEQKEKYSVLGFTVYRAPFQTLFNIEDDDTHTYDNFSEWWVQSKKTEINYVAGGTQAISNIVTNHYDNAFHKLITSSEINTSKRDAKTTYFKYPHDFSGTPVYDEMITKNIISPIVEKSTYIHKNNTDYLLEKIKTNYQDWGNGVIAPSTVTGTKGNNNTETRLHYYGYDTYGNVLSAAKENDIKSLYVWGYKKMYPVAEVVGSDLTTVSGLVDQTVLDNPNSTEAQVKAQLDALRNGLLSSKALVTTYTYKPLVGVSTQTDPNGKTTYYEYDSFNRLKAIKDKDGNVVKTFDYQYQKPPNQ